MISKEDIHHLAIIRKTVSDIFEEIQTEYDIVGFKILEVGPTKDRELENSITYATVHTLDVDPQSVCTFIGDICATNEHIMPEDTYDVIMCTEVLEHTLNPFKAVDELHRVLKPGGIAIITTPLNFRKHGPSPDCWRFTQDGLKELFKNFRKVEIEEIHSEEYYRFLFPVQLKVKGYK